MYDAVQNAQNNENTPTNDGENETPAINNTNTANEGEGMGDRNKGVPMTDGTAKSKDY